MFNKLKTISNLIYINLSNNLTLYLVFQLLFNLLLIYLDKNQINKFNGDNFILHLIGFIVFMLYSIPLSLLNSFNSFVLNAISIDVNPFVHILFSKITIFISTIILCNLPPFSKYLKKLVKIKSPILSFIINCLILLIIISSTKI